MLRDFLNVFIYLDNILMYTRFWFFLFLVEHRVYVRSVLQQLLENHLYMKAKKWEFHSLAVSFLDYMDPVKIVLSLIGPPQPYGKTDNASSDSAVSLLHL